MIKRILIDTVENSISLERNENNLVGGVVDVKLKTQNMTQFQAFRKYSEVTIDEVSNQTG